jgi:glucose-6-phosphate isomerase
MMLNNPEFNSLKKHVKELGRLSIKDLFEEDNQRGIRYRIVEDGLYFDYSKNILTEKTLKYLFEFAESRNLKLEIERMFSGEKINGTENRAVLHTALRDFGTEPIMVNGKDVKPEIIRVRKKMERMAEMIRGGRFMGYSRQPIRSVVNIGIGGSDLGPRMVTKALTNFVKDGLKVFFVSNIDSADLSNTLKDLNPEETLFIISSKSFTTQETMTNANSAKQWVLNYYGNKESIAAHFFAISTNVEAVIKFGIKNENILEFWDWVGGRFSLTSAIGFSIMIAIGCDHFYQLLKGFFSIDRHFRYKELDENIPVIMGLLGFYYNNLYGYQTHAVIPYSQNLSELPLYLQQLDMESNGKSVSRDGRAVSYQTGPIVWGAPGTNGQHAFFQLIHQGTKVVPCDFIAFMEKKRDPKDHHIKLISNLLAQAEALAFGKTAEELRTEGVAESLIPFRVMPGNRPSNILFIKKLDPYNLGKLIALYEHKVFVMGILWDIYSFDQWGVQLGKQMAVRILEEIQSPEKKSSHDSSTQTLIDYFREVKIN